MTIQTQKNVPFRLSEYPCLKHLIRANQQSLSQNTVVDGINQSYLIDEVTGAHINGNSVTGSSFAVSGTGIALSGFEYVSGGTDGLLSGGSLVALPAANWVIVSQSPITTTAPQWRYGGQGGNYAKMGTTGQAPRAVGATADSTNGTGNQYTEQGAFTAMVCNSSGVVTTYQNDGAGTYGVASIGNLTNNPGAITPFQDRLSLADGAIGGFPFKAFLVADFSVGGLPVNILNDLTWLAWSLRVGNQTPPVNWRGRT